MLDGRGRQAEEAASTGERKGQAQGTAAGGKATGRPVGAPRSEDAEEGLGSGGLGRTRNWGMSGWWGLAKRPGWSSVQKRSSFHVLPERGCDG